MLTRPFPRSYCDETQLEVEKVGEVTAEEKG